MITDPSLGIPLVLGALGLWFLLRLWPWGDRPDTSHAFEARRLITNGFTWWYVGGAIYSIAELLPYRFPEWANITLGITLGGCAVMGIYCLYRGDLEGFQATNPPTEADTPRHPRDARNRRERRLDSPEVHHRHGPEGH